MDHINESADRLAAAAQSLEEVVRSLQARHDELGAKIERIVAAVESDADTRARLEARIAELEAANQELKARSVQRKTLPPMVTAILAKGGLDAHDRLDSGVMDKVLSALSVEQRIAVKAEMARAGMID